MKPSDIQTVISKLMQKYNYSIKDLKKVRPTLQFEIKVDQEFVNFVIENKDFFISSDSTDFEKLTENSNRFDINEDYVYFKIDGENQRFFREGLSGLIGKQLVVDFAIFGTMSLFIFINDFNDIRNFISRELTSDSLGNMFGIYELLNDETGEVRMFINVDKCFYKIHSKEFKVQNSKLSNSINSIVKLIKDYKKTKEDLKNKVLLDIQSI